MKKLRTCLLLLSLFFVFKIDAQVRFIPLFSFTNIGTCTGPVNLIDNATDPFSPPNSREANVGNALTILGAFGDAYIGNYTSGNNQCCSDGTTTGGTATGYLYCTSQY